MFDLEKYIKIGAYLKHDNDGKITVHINANIIDDEVNKEVEELQESLLNARQILGYDFALIVSENSIKVMKELE